MVLKCFNKIRNSLWVRKEETYGMIDQRISSCIYHRKSKNLLNFFLDMNIQVYLECWHEALILEGREYVIKAKGPLVRNWDLEIMEELLSLH